MRITHPQSTYRGVPAEDTFFVNNDQQVQLGSGYLVPFLQRELYPVHQRILEHITVLSLHGDLSIFYKIGRILHQLLLYFRSEGSSSESTSSV